MPQEMPYLTVQREHAPNEFGLPAVYGLAQHRFRIGRGLLLSFGRRHNAAQNDRDFGVTTWSLDLTTYDLAVVSNVEVYAGPVNTAGLQVTDGRVWFDYASRTLAWAFPAVKPSSANGPDINTIVHGLLTWTPDGVVTVIHSGVMSTAQGATDTTFDGNLFMHYDRATSQVTMLATVFAETGPEYLRFQTASLNVETGAHGEWSPPESAGLLAGLSDDSAWHGHEYGIDTHYLGVQDNVSGAVVSLVATLSGGGVTIATADHPYADGSAQTQPRTVDGDRSEVVRYYPAGSARHLAYHVPGGSVVKGLPLAFGTDPLGQPNSYWQPDWVDYIASTPSFNDWTQQAGRGPEFAGRTATDAWIVEPSADLDTLQRVYRLPLLRTGEQPRRRADPDGYVRWSWASQSQRILIYGLPGGIPDLRCTLDVGHRVFAVPTAAGHDYVVFCVLHGDEINLTPGQRIVAIPTAAGHDYAIAHGPDEIAAVGQRILAIPTADGHDYTVLT